MQQSEETCGEELAASAVVPEQVGALFRHVAVNLRGHATWVGRANAAAASEHDAMIAVAAGYEDLSAAAERTANLMRNLRSLKPAPHDPSGMDRQGFVAWMKVKVQLQRALANLLLEHAEQSEEVLAQFESGRGE